MKLLGEVSRCPRRDVVDVVFTVIPLRSCLVTSRFPCALAEFLAAALALRSRFPLPPEIENGTVTGAVTIG